MEFSNLKFAECWKSVFCLKYNINFIVQYAAPLTLLSGATARLSSTPTPLHTGIYWKEMECIAYGFRLQTDRPSAFVRFVCDARFLCGGL